MLKSGAALVRHALEAIGVKQTFGIPGVHNTEIYDELNRSATITPYLVGHEMAAACMADAVSRTGDSIGCMLIVPAAGVTHAASGIGEAMLAGIPLLIISGGIHRGSGKRYQLHDIDQHQILKPLTKATYLVEDHQQLIPTLFEAYWTAVSGEPGPVFVEVPVDIQLFRGEVSEPLPQLQDFAPAPAPLDEQAIAAAAEKLLAAKRPALFVGWGALRARRALVELAELLGAPVATTLQGVSSFPGDHPLHTGLSFGGAAVSAARKTVGESDCLLAIGTRFGEIATGSYSVEPPEELIHIDINPAVFNANYPTSLCLQGDATEVLEQLLVALRAAMNERLNQGQSLPQNRSAELTASIAKYKLKTHQAWLAGGDSRRVNPAQFFTALRAKLAADAIIVADDGNHTFLTAELLPINRAAGFISPTDFNAMGYCIPACNGAKLANPDSQVIGIVGDGAMFMTGMEVATAVHYQLGVIYVVFNDGELAQISQAQELPYRYKTCTKLAHTHWGAFAEAMECAYLAIDHERDIDTVLDRALLISEQHQPVIIDLKVDYSQKTAFTKGIVKANLNRFETTEKLRFVGRALKRKVVG